MCISGTTLQNLWTMDKPALATIKKIVFSPHKIELCITR
uniref:Uncharacterized protein n=1 Tax=Arundo donax TaxID=35708 RepID=A0A0A8ZEQ0_ARUDO